MKNQTVNIESKSGLTNVFVDNNGDDHIVTRLIVNKRGEEFDAMLPYGEHAWQVAVERAKIALVFVGEDVDFTETQVRGADSSASLVS